MRELVLDASVVLTWFATGEERGAAAARQLRAEYEAGRLAVLVPSLLFVELLNVAGRRWGWDGNALLELADLLEALGFDVAEPDLGTVAGWVARGLTAYDATYVALAEDRGLRLVTDDRQILDLAPDLADALDG